MSILLIILMIPASFDSNSKTSKRKAGTTKASYKTEVINGFAVKLPSFLTEGEKDVIRNLLLNMVYVEGGNFTMGQIPDYDPGVIISPRNIHVNSFYIDKYEVTQSLWWAIMHTNPAKFGSSKNGRFPMENVSYNDCQMFINKLNNITGLHFRLPTAEEWEYAARGGKYSKGYKFSGSNKAADVAWVGENFRKTTRPVGLKAPNELGLYDMSGNVKEWTSSYFTSNGLTDPNITYKIIRGDCYYDTPRDVLSGVGWGVNQKSSGVGFRLVLTK